MKFINNTGKKVIARIKQGNFYDWITINEGEKIDLPESYGFGLGLEIFKGENEKNEDEKDVEEISEQEKKKNILTSLKKLKAWATRLLKTLSRFFLQKKN
ncbi:MAG: hypothetical protein PWQ59_444 [Thermoanaerobacterium sp.]|nr:hypothetical protein [Thermoanaerobacterium sp.]